MSQRVIAITVNGQIHEVPEGETVRSLIARRGLAGGACAAEVNGKLVGRKDHESRILHAGDSVELVTLVGGG